MLPTVTRATIWRSVFLKRWVGVVCGLYSLIGVLDFIRDRLLPERFYPLWDKYYVLPSFDLKTWIVIGLALSVIIIMEGTFQFALVREAAFNRRFADLEIELHSLRTQQDTKKARREIRDRLSNLIAECKAYETRCLAPKDHVNINGVLSGQIEEWQDRVRSFLELDIFGDHSCWEAFLAATQDDYNTTTNDKRNWVLATNRQYVEWLKLLRAKRMTLEHCLSQYPPL